MSKNDNLRVLDRLHQGKSYSQNLLSSGLLSDSTEWWASGPQEILPWAGSFRGSANIAKWFEILNGKMEYDRFEPFETVTQDDTVVVLYHAHGRARSTGRTFESDICRIYEFQKGKLVRVRNYYDTAAYVAALNVH